MGWHTQEVLDLLPPSCERHFVGKRGGQASIKQPAINELLVGLCRQGKAVVRLKGGCCSTFSRVSSEIAALSTAGCPYEMLPGISSATSAPVLSGE
jgi:siroheme synthase